MQLKVSQVKRIFDKLGMEVRPSDHIFAYFRHNGKLIIKTKISHGSGDAKAKDKIRQDFKLLEDDFCKLRDCPLSKEGYIEILKKKGLILN